MQSGYLAIETHSDRPGVVRIRTSELAPDPDSAEHGPQRLRYIARFNDLDAALMHTHALLKRRLVDPDTHLYRVSLERAISATESLDLKHRRIYLDAELSDESRKAVDELTAGFRARRQAWVVIFQTIGYIGIAMLLFNLLFLSFP